MKKNTFKINNYLTGLCLLTLMVLFFSVFTEVNAQSALSVNNGTHPGNVQQDATNGAAEISIIKIETNQTETSTPIVITDEAPGTAHVDGNMNPTGTANTLNSDGRINMPEQASEKATQKNKSKKSVNQPESK
jgi:hypothetical protein